MNLNHKIGLGSAQFGLSYGVSNTRGQTLPDEVAQILEYACNNGIVFIDTASAYGNAEEILGYSDLKFCKVISKFMSGDISETISVQLKKSLDYLKIDSLYGYLAHRPLSLINNKKQWDELLLLKQQKKIKKIGFSLNTPGEMQLLLDHGMVPDLIQVPYNFFDNRFKNILIDLKSRGCEIHTRSVFLQGLFFADVQKLPSFFDEVKKDICGLQEKFRNNLPAVLLKYVLTLDFVDVVIIGVENKDQLDDNLSNIGSAEILTSQNITFSEEVLMPSHWPK